MIYESFADVPRGRYGVIYADPAWKFAARSAKGENRPGTAGAHYRLETLAQIKAHPVREVAARDCHLFLWTTGPHLAQAFEVLAAWGFRYSTVGFVWAKLTPTHRSQPQFFYDAEHSFWVGQGYTTRSNAEYCLLGRRGSPKRLGKGIRQLIVSPLREHSRKPDEIRERIAKYAGDVPRLEMNARAAVPGWDQWGDEVAKFTPVRPRIRLARP